MIHTQCISCGSNQLNRVIGFVRVPLLKCVRCSLVFAEQIPTTTELANYYSNYGLNHYYSPITAKRYNEWLDTFEPFRMTNNLLDVGCGCGYLLDEAAKRGWNVYGTEYGDALVQFCADKNIIMEKGSLTSDSFNGITFDVITSIEVVEHINNPAEELIQYYRLLRAGGLVLCTTPNFNCIERMWLGDKYNVINWPEHLTYYTPNTLGDLFAKNGFRKKKIDAHGFSLTRFRISAGQSDQLVVSSTSDDERVRSKIESKPMLKFAKGMINGILNLFKMGSSMKGWFILNK